MGGHPTRSGVNRCYMVLLSILLGEFRSPRILASVCGGWPNHQPVKAVASCAGLLFVAFALGPWEQNCPSPRKPLDDMLTVSRYETMEISWKYHVDICRLQSSAHSKSTSSGIEVLQLHCVQPLHTSKSISIGVVRMPRATMFSA